MGTRENPRSCRPCPNTRLKHFGWRFRNTPHLLPDFEAHWKRVIGDAFTITPVPAFMRLWWTQYAIARNPVLDSHLRDLEARAAKSEDPEKSIRLLEEYSRLRHEAAERQPGE